MSATTTPSTSTPANVCPDCGAALAEGDEYCYACGAQIPATGGAQIPATGGAQTASGGSAQTGAGGSAQTAADGDAEASMPRPEQEQASPTESPHISGIGAGAAAGAPASQQPDATETPVAPANVEQGTETGTEGQAEEAQGESATASAGNLPQTEAPPAELPGAAPAQAPENECPACGAEVKPGDAFCEYCGAALVEAEASAPQAAPAAAQPQPNAPAQPTQAAAGPRLVVTESGVEIPLPNAQETVAGREDPYSGIFPDIDLTPHGGEQAGVSRRHFRISYSDGRYQIEDLNSTNFTLVNRQRLEPGKPMPLSSGDEIRAGRLKLIFRAS
jgi:hypothetical protein